MAIMSRLSRLFQADVHALLDQLEEPEALLKQSLRDMEAEITSSQQALKASQLRHEQQKKLHATLSAAIQELQAQLDLCFNSADEQLAKTLIRRRLEMQQQTRLLETTIVQLAQDVDERNEQVREYQLRYESLKQQADCFLSVEAKSQQQTQTVLVSNDDVELAYLAEKQARSSADVGGR